MKRIKVLTRVLGISALMALSVGCSGDEPSEMSIEDSSKISEVSDASDKPVIGSEEDFKDMYLDPESHKGQKIEFTAEAFMNSEEDSGRVYFQCYAYEDDSLSTVVAAPKGTEVKDGDIVQISGKVEGIFEGENLFGKAMSFPAIAADTVEKVDYADAMAPEIATKEVSKDISQPEPVQEISGYENYFNGRFGFSVDYPSSFLLDRAPDNGDGQRFYSQDEKAEIIAYGSHNALEMSLDEEYSEMISDINQVSQVAYKAKGDNWFVLSWKEDGYIYYQKVYVGTGGIQAVRIGYAEAESGKYNSMVEHISGSFSPGDIWR